MNIDLFSCPFDEETVENIALLRTMNSFVAGGTLPFDGSPVDRWKNSEDGKIPSDLMFIIRAIFSNVENTNRV